MICICVVSLLVALFVRTMDHRDRRKRKLESEGDHEAESKSTAQPVGDAGALEEKVAKFPPESASPREPEKKELELEQEGLET
jgi:hypothetical protein